MSQNQNRISIHFSGQILLSIELPPWHLFPRVVGWDVLVDGVPPAPDEEKGGQVRDCRSELEWSFQVMSCLGNISVI